MLVTRIILVLLLPLAGGCAAEQFLPTSMPIPGGVAIIEIPATASPEQWRYRDRPLWILTKADGARATTTTTAVGGGSGRALALVGIPLGTKPGSVSLTTGDDERVVFQVLPHQYEESRIYLTNKAYVTPPQDTHSRIRAEAAEIRAQFKVFSNHQPSLPFSLPVAGAKSSGFGLRRFFNDQPRRPHSGLDFAAPAGTLVSAPAAGTILATNDYYFNGKTIFIDHGQGLVSMYCHLSQISVTPEQQVNKGEPIGRVGSTGRSTGAHLHWSVNLGGTMVNPLLFTRAQDADQLEANSDR